MCKYFDDLLEKEACLNEVKSGKIYVRSKHHNRFNCKWSARKFEVKGSGECKVEISGQHNHEGNKNFAVSLPKKCKDITDEAISLYTHHTPTIIKGIIEDKYEVVLSKKEFMQLQSYIARRKNKLKDGYEDNTLSGLLQFCIDNSYEASSCGNKMHITDYTIETDDTTIIITSKNMLMNADALDLVMCMDSTHKLIFNGFPIHVIGCIDK